jgi:hypothetical protein
VKRTVFGLGISEYLTGFIRIDQLPCLSPGAIILMQIHRELAVDLAEGADFAGKRGQYIKELQQNVSVLIAGRSGLASASSRTHSRVYLLVLCLS